MSGSLFSIEYIDNGQTVSHEGEAAGAIGAAIYAVWQVVSPFVVAAVKGALVGSVVSAGIAYAGGARGADVWRAAGYGALGGAITGGIGHALSGAGGAVSGGTSGAAAPTTAVTTASVPGAVPGTVSGGAAGGITSGASGIFTGAAGNVVSPTMMSSIRSFFGSALNNQTIQRLGAALINAAVSGQSMGNMDSLVAQQKAELDRMTAGQRNEYLARAQETLAAADKMDPHWRARLAMADVQGAMTKQADQSYRDISVKQGGSLDAGQRKAYKRGTALEIAKGKALAYNQAYSDAEVARDQIKAQGMQQLQTAWGMGRQGWQDQLGLDVSAFNFNRAQNENRAGMFTDIFSSAGDHAPGASPDPSEDDDEEDTGFTGFRI